MIQTIIYKSRVNSFKAFTKKKIHAFEKFINLIKLGTIQIEFPKLARLG